MNKYLKYSDEPFRPSEIQLIVTYDEGKLQIVTFEKL